MQGVMDLTKQIRNIPDFPKKGILFRDITTLLNNKRAFQQAINQMASFVKDKQIDFIIAVESRGFIFGGALAYKLNCGFVPVRKKGKLPSKTYQYTYSLEYGEDSLEIHEDAFLPNSKVLILDDLLATGGTTVASINLTKKLNADIIGILYLIELTALGGREKLKNYPVYSLIKY